MKNLKKVKNIKLVFLLLFLNYNLYSQNTSNIIKVTGVAGTAYINERITPKEAKEEALKDAQRNALKKAGVSEFLQSSVMLITDSKNEKNSDFLSSEFQSHLEGAILGSIGRQIRAVHPGWSEDKVRIEAMEFFSNELKERRAEFVAQLNDTIDNILFDEDMIDEILRDRGGVLDATAGKYSEYARFGLHELIAEVGRMITSTPAERANPNNNIGKIDDSTVDLLESLFPSISRSQWLNIIRIAYPGIQIKVLRNK